MAYQIKVLDITIVAATDLSADQYKFVSLDSNGEAVLTGAGERALGVLQNDPEAGESATVRVYGLTKLVTGASVAPNDAIESDGSAQGITQDTGTGNGIALTSTGAEGEIATVLIDRLG